jgi:hypothetical protein
LAPPLKILINEKNEELIFIFLDQIGVILTSLIVSDEFDEEIK